MKTRTKVERVHEVERLSGTAVFAGRELYWASCYRIPGETGDVLVDALPPRLASLAAAPTRPTPATTLLTHHHEDHSGGACALAARGSRVLAPEGAIGPLSREWELPLYRAFTWGTPEPFKAEPIARRVQTPAGTFRAVDCPGHSFEHVAYLHERTGLLFTGDAYFGKLRYARAVENVPLWIESLRTLAALDAVAALPAHGNVVEKPRAAFEETADWLDNLGRRARTLRAQGKSVRDIRRDLLGAEGFQFWFSSGDFSGMNLVRSLLGSEAP